MTFAERNAILAALAAAALFGAGTPAAKLLLGTTGPWLLAGLLYLGSGLGLLAFRLSTGRRVLPAIPFAERVHGGSAANVVLARRQLRAGQSC